MHLKMKCFNYYSSQNVHCERKVYQDKKGKNLNITSFFAFDAVGDDMKE